MGDFPEEEEIPACGHGFSLCSRVPVLGFPAVCPMDSRLRRSGDPTTVNQLLEVS